jgi:hypothetical protein
MSDSDVQKFGFQKQEMMRQYGRCGINFSKHLPVDDANLDDQATLDSMFIAAQYLDDMINDKGLNVFIHCSNGQTRASTIALVYMSLFKVHSQSGNLKEMAKIMKTHHSLSQPNIRAAEKILA